MHGKPNPNLIFSRNNPQPQAKVSKNLVGNGADKKITQSEKLKKDENSPQYEALCAENLRLIEELDSMRVELNFQLGSSLKERSILELQLEEAKLRIADLEKRGSMNTDKEIFILTKQITNLRQEILELQSSAQNFMEESIYYKAKYNEAVKGLQASSIQNNQWSTKEIEIKKENLLLYEKLKLQEKEIENMRQRLQEFESECKEKDKKIVSILKDRADQVKLSDLENSFKKNEVLGKTEEKLKVEFQKEIENYKTKYENLISKLKSHFDSEKMRFVADIELKVKESEENSKCVEFLKTQITEIETRESEERCRLKSLCKEQDIRLASLEKENEGLINHLKEFAHEITEKDKRIFYVEEEKREVCKNLSQRLNDQVSTISDLKIQLSRYSLEFDTFDKMISDIADKDSAEYILDSDCSRRKTILSQVIQKFKSQAIESQRLKLEIDQLQNTKNTLDQKIEVYNTNIELDKGLLIDKLQLLEKSNQRLSAERDIIKDNLNKLHQENLELTQDIRKLIAAREKTKSISELLTAKDKFGLHSLGYTTDEINSTAESQTSLRPLWYEKLINKKSSN